ncbi:MAG: hypothetical protein Q4B67_04415 [Eubacteriales bacterium]|nr:hypothetical protein [Eubacteriales bacterium]
MDLDALISEICRRVQERVAACESESGEANCIAYKGAEAKPVLGIISENHGDTCHDVYECAELSKFYEMKCALNDDTWDVENWEGVIAYTLTNEVLGKIVNGIFDTRYTKAFGKALLAGKKIFVPEEEVELYKYKETAPRGYYKKLEDNLKRLMEYGVEIVPGSRIASVILGSECVKCAEPVVTKCDAEAKEITFTKKVLSERDMKMAYDGGVMRVLVTKKTIVTDLAKDYATKYHIVIEKVDC